MAALWLWGSSRVLWSIFFSSRPVWLAPGAVVRGGTWIVAALSIARSAFCEI